MKGNIGQMDQTLSITYPKSLALLPGSWHMLLSMP